MRLALDTSAYSALMRGHRDVVSRVRRAEAVLLPAVVAGELLYGFRFGSRFEENATRLEAFLDAPSVDLLPVSFVTADRFGLIVTALRGKGTPIPTNDIWIAAQAMEAGADLLSSDAHFGLVDGLAWISFSPKDENSVHERVRLYHNTLDAEDIGGGRSKPMIQQLQDNRDDIDELCRRFAVRRLEAFGSAVLGGFDPATSDVDFLVEFLDIPPIGHADAYFGLLEGLQSVLGRNVDLVVISAVKNPYFLEQIERSRTLLYAA